MVSRWIEGNFHQSLESTLPNFNHLFHACNQNDLLAQRPVVRAFLTHGGLSSLFEAAYHGVPTVTLPIVADQLDNAVRSEELGIGVTIGMDPMARRNVDVTSDEVFVALNRSDTAQQVDMTCPSDWPTLMPICPSSTCRVLIDPSFEQRSAAVSKILQSRPQAPSELAADLIMQTIMDHHFHYGEAEEAAALTEDGRTCSADLPATIIPDNVRVRLPEATMVA